MTTMNTETLQQADKALEQAANDAAAKRKRKTDTARPRRLR